MKNDVQELVELNLEIGEAENSADVDRLGELVAPQLAFMRRDGSVVNRSDYLGNVKAGERITDVESVCRYGNRAVVTCRITDGAAVTHNIRLFIKSAGRWRLLGWANEAL